MYARILWMNDLSHRADACLDAVVTLARLGGGRVVLCHATGSAIQGRPRKDQEQPSLLPPIREQAQEHLALLEHRLCEAEVPCEVRIQPGKAEKVADQLVDALGIDLVVAGTTGVSGLDHLLVGSTASRFLRHLRVPVLVVGRRVFKSAEALLCPVDLDHAEQERGIWHAAALARASGATVTFLTVLEPGTTSTAADAAEVQLRSKVEALLGEALPRHWRARAIVDSSAVDGILHAAQTHDIVVMSAHGKTGLERLLTGSVAETVVKSCHVSVLVGR